MKNFIAVSSRFLPSVSSFEVRSTMQIRCVSTASAKLQASKLQLGRILNKVMQLDRNKRNRKEPVDSALLADSRMGKANATHRCPPAPSTRGRRVTILNKVFMKHITDLMATGEVASSLVGKGIEISHVEVTPDFSCVNVYWFAEQGNTDNYEKILRVSAGHLQHELSQLRVIGLVPPIQFVKNKHYGKVKEVEDRLATVDFGPDYVPTGGHIATLPGAPILETSLSAELRARIFSVDGQSEKCEQSDYQIPEMRQDVMGFDHAAAMKKIWNSVKKAQSVAASSVEQGQSANGDASLSYPPTRDVVDFLSSKEQGKLFSDFLKKRAIEEKRKQRLVPLLEVKLQEERDWVERMRDNDEDDDEDDEEEDASIDEPYTEEYESEKHN